MKNFITQNLKKFFKAKISYARFTTCVAFLFVASTSFAAEKNNFLEQYSSELTQVENYLNNIKNLSAKFTQESSEGGTVEGKFFLSRPGKMRIEYSAQPKIVIVVNGSVLSYYDVDLDEVSRLGTNTTPASFLTRANISFSAKDVEITNVKKSADQLKISVMKKNRKEAGEFSLIFTTNPLRFIKMEVKNDLDQVIAVKLSDPDFTSIIPNKMFVLKNSEN
jgi:outer membrane lipoprotein-sorting protein